MWLVALTSVRWQAEWSGDSCPGSAPMSFSFLIFSYSLNRKKGVLSVQGHLSIELVRLSKE